MDTRSHLQQLFSYDRWANVAIVAALQDHSAPPAKSIQLLAHIIGAQQLWMERIEAAIPTAKVWPDWNVAQCAEQFERVQRSWRERIDAATPASLLATTAYTNSKGERWESTFQDIAMHVAMHGTYHRGQIAANLRASGVTPPYTDFIEAVRRGRLG